MLQHISHSLRHPYLCLFDHSVCTCRHPMDVIRTHLLRCSHGGEHTTAHDNTCDANYYIIRDAGRVVVVEKTIFLPSSIPRARGGRVDLVISEPARGHTLLDVVIADPTRVDLFAEATVVPHHAASEAARQTERKYNGRRRGDSPLRHTMRSCLECVSQLAFQLNTTQLSNSR